MSTVIFRVFVLLAPLFAGVALVSATTAVAGVFEYSFGFFFSQTRYTEQSFNWTRRWTMSLGYYFSERAEIEVSIHDMVDRTLIMNQQDTVFHDQVYSLNWVQGIAGKSFPVQPYVKLGIGQLNREASGSYAYGGSPPKLMDVITGVLGAGLRIELTKSFGIRSEITSYIAEGNIRNWKNNIGFTVGGTIYF